MKRKKFNGRGNYLLKKYGITEDQYEDLLRKQEFCCGVCRRPAVGFRTRLCVDHDHSTGEIRGLLCNYCNRRIVGRHRRPAALLKAGYEYLVAVYPGWIVPVRKKHKKKRRKKHGTS